jgi:hypothetical protein
VISANTGCPKSIGHNLKIFSVLLFVVCNPQETLHIVSVRVFCHAKFHVFSSSSVNVRREYEILSTGSRSRKFCPEILVMWGITVFRFERSFHNIDSLVRFEVLTVGSMKIAVLRVVAPCCLVDV